MRSTPGHYINDGLLAWGNENNFICPADFLSFSNKINVHPTAHGNRQASKA